MSSCLFFKPKTRSASFCHETLPLSSRQTAGRACFLLQRSLRPDARGLVLTCQWTLQLCLHREVVERVRKNQTQKPKEEPVTSTQKAVPTLRRVSWSLPATPSFVLIPGGRKAGSAAVPLNRFPADLRLWVPVLRSRTVDGAEVAGGRVTWV